MVHCIGKFKGKKNVLKRTGERRGRGVRNLINFTRWGRNDRTDQEKNAKEKSVTELVASSCKKMGRMMG